MQDEAVGVGFADALTNKLGNIKALEMISASTGRSMASTEPQAIKKEVNAAYVLSGELSEDDNSTRIAARLISTEDAKEVWSETLSAPKGDLLTLQTALAEKIWTALGVEPLPLEL